MYLWRDFLNKQNINKFRPFGPNLKNFELLLLLLDFKPKIRLREDSKQCYRAEQQKFIPFELLPFWSGNLNPINVNFCFCYGSNISFLFLIWRGWLMKMYWISTQFGMLLAEESKWTRWGCHIQRKKIKLAKRKCNWINLTH